MEKEAKIFQEKGYVLVKNFVPKQTAKMLFNYLVCLSVSKKLLNPNIRLEGDEQVPESLLAINGDTIFESLLFSLREKMELNTGLSLLPTYSYRRLYTHGNILHKHTDRPECEISATIKLSDNSEYNWPIWMQDTAIELEDGDAVLYRGCDLEHWREPCGGSKKHLMGQTFLHYVDVDGPFIDSAFEKNQIRQKAYDNFLNYCSQLD
tara:strand:- start:719 stop:1339 length:621 start_codon:yes stop_codon:yes gene_type:complete